MADRHSITNSQRETVIHVTNDVVLEVGLFTNENWFMLGTNYDSGHQHRVGADGHITPDGAMRANKGSWIDRWLVLRHDRTLQLQLPSEWPVYGQLVFLGMKKGGQPESQPPFQVLDQLVLTRTDLRTMLCDVLACWYLPTFQIGR